MGGEQKEDRLFWLFSFSSLYPACRTVPIFPTSNDTAWNSIEKWAQDIAVATFHAKDGIEVYEVG